MGSCGNTHTPETVKTAAETSQPPPHPTLPVREPLLLPAPRPGAYLAHGRARHATQQLQDSQWASEQRLEAKAELTVTRPDGTKGRIDHIVFLDQARQSAVITEYKTDRFDRHTPGSLRDRMDEILSQIDGYRFGELHVGDERVLLSESQSVLHIDQRPTRDGYAEYIEDRCAEAGVTVIFLDE